jgi:low affinity Fe/Cu permease
MPIRGRSAMAIILPMPNRKSSWLSVGLEQMSTRVTHWTGTTQAFTLALAAVAAWLAAGPFFRFSDAWQLVINTSTTIATFLMVFLLQRSQNKDSLALHLKVNEIVAVLEGASNRLIDVEGLSEDDLETLHQHFTELAALARKEADVTVSHSVEEARQRHSAKFGAGRAAKRGK